MNDSQHAWATPARGFGPLPQGQALVSVLIRTRDRPLLLTRAMRGVAAQTCKPLEVVIANDGGDRAALEACLAASWAQDPAVRLTVLHAPASKGRWQAAVDALAASRGPLVALLDDDDSWEPDFLAATTSRFAEADGAGLAAVCTEWNEIDETIAPDGTITRLDSRRIAPASGGFIAIESLLRPWNFQPSATVYRREALRRAGGWNTALTVGGDWDLNLRLLAQGPVAVVPRALAGWHLRRSLAATGSALSNATNDAARYGAFHAEYRTALLREALLRQPEALGQMLLTAQAAAGTEARLAAIEARLERIATALENPPPPLHRRVLGRLRRSAGRALRALAATGYCRWCTWLQVIRHIRREFVEAHGRLPRLLRPQSFSEKMQWRKLFERDPQFAAITDKLDSRAWIRARAPEAALPELLWWGAYPASIPFDRLDPPYVIKGAHATGQTIIVRSAEDCDPAAIRRTTAGWLDFCHGQARAEPAYINLPRRLIIERLVTDAKGGGPIERRIFTFGGKAHFIQTTLYSPQGRLRTAGYHSPDWERVPIVLSSEPDPEPPPRPPHLAEMLALAERLAAGLSHARVDIYDCGDRLVMGEVTLYSWSGMWAFRDPAQDLALGRLWPIDQPVRRGLRALLFERWDIPHPPAPPPA